MVLGVGCWVFDGGWWVVLAGGGWCWWMWVVDGAWMILANTSVVQNGDGDRDGDGDDGAHSPDLHAPTSLFDARMAFLSGSSESTVCARPAVAVVVVVGGSHEDSFVFLL